MVAELRRVDQLAMLTQVSLLLLVEHCDALVLQLHDGLGSWRELGFVGHPLQTLRLLNVQGVQLQLAEVF